MFTTAIVTLTTMASTTGFVIARRVITRMIYNWALAASISTSDPNLINNDIIFSNPSENFYELSATENTNKILPELDLDISSTNQNYNFDLNNSCNYKNNIKNDNDFYSKMSFYSIVNIINRKIINESKKIITKTVKNIEWSSFANNMKESVKNVKWSKFIPSLIK